MGEESRKRDDGNEKPAPMVCRRTRVSPSVCTHRGGMGGGKFIHLVSTRRQNNPRRLRLPVDGDFIRGCFSYLLVLERGSADSPSVFQIRISLSLGFSASLL